MKKSILALTFLGTSLLQAMEADKQQEKFNFADLPHEVQNLIVEQAWSDIDTVENMKELASSAFRDKCFRQQIPIHFYKLFNGKPCISEVGFINHSSVKSAYLPSLKNTDLFIRTPENIVFSTRLKNRGSCMVTVHSACFSVLGKVAIAWLDENFKAFITVFSLKNILNKKEFDLSQNTTPLPKFPFHITITPVSLFTLDGSKLFIEIGPLARDSNIDPFSDITTDTRDIPNDKPLTPAEKAKRLGIATVGAKALIATHLRKTK